MNLPLYSPIAPGGRDSRIARVGNVGLAVHSHTSPIICHEPRPAENRLGCEQAAAEPDCSAVTSARRYFPLRLAPAGAARPFA